MKRSLSLHYLLWCALIVGGFFFSFSSAEYAPISSVESYCPTSPICGTASEPLTDLMDFVRDMANSMKTMGTEGDYLWKYVNPNRFKGNIFTPPAASSLLDRLGRNITQKLLFAAAVAAILTKPQDAVGLNDFVWLFALLVKNRVYLRDIKVIWDVESIVSTKKYELGAGGWRFETINPENRALMNTIIKKYVDKGLLDPATVVKDGATYNNVTMALSQLIVASKRFIYYDSTWGFDSIFYGLYENFRENGIKIKVNSNAMRVMYVDYGCVRGIEWWFKNPCDSSWKKFANNMKQLWTSTTDGWGKSRDTLQRSSRALSNTLSDLKNTYAKQAEARENDLVRSMYGTQKLWSGFSFRRLVNFNFTQNNGNISFADIGKTVSGIVTNVKSRELAKKDINAKKDEITMAISTKWWSDLSLMSEYTNDVFVDQSLDLNLATFSEVKDTTPNFALLGDQIYAIKDGILGWKDKKNSLIRSLGNACETQCLYSRWACR